MRSLILLSLALLLPVLAIADPQPWMKKENPNELSFYFQYDVECAIDGENISDAVKDVLVRSRIKPLSNVLPDLFLMVVFSCSEYQGNYLYSYDIEFAQYSPSIGSFIRYGRLSKGGFGVETESGIVTRMKEEVEATVADYLRANFDLGDDE